MATCRIHEIDKKYLSIVGTECSREAWELDPEGLCLLCSRQPDKDKDGAFTKAIRAKLRLQDYNFRGVFFPGPFSLKVLTEQKDFTFNKPADFSNAIFSGPADFSNAIFTGRANFLQATFQEGTNFNNAIFQVEAIFDRATFQVQANFRKATFNERAYFPGATFQVKANFLHTTFRDWAVFSEANFLEEAMFQAVFRGGAFFGGAIFGRANFIGVKFQKKASFIKSTFHEAAFNGSTFMGDAQFVGINHQKKEGPSSTVFYGNFKNVNVDKDASLVFQDCSLDKVKFSGTDLRSVVFQNVDWARRHGRNVVYDEIMLHQAEQKPSIESYARVEELYRGLKLNFGEAGDLKKVGDFHYGEMEMHRRANPTQLWYQFYWALSGYGERPLRSLLVLWGLFLTFAGVFFWLEPCLLGGHTWEGLENAFLYVLQQGTLQRPDWFKPTTFLSKMLSSLIPVLIPGQVALFFLALRNRLGRRR